MISVTDSTGALVAINTYDEYGIPGASNSGRFQYTGQKWLSDLGLYDYKFRMYSGALGRFVQPDPIGYADNPNLYNYVLGDPVNLVDPLGLRTLTVCRTVLASAGGSPFGNPMQICTSYNIPDDTTSKPPPGREPGQGPGPAKPRKPKNPPPPKANKTRSQCAAFGVGAVVEGILTIGTEGPLVGYSVGEIAVGGLAIAAAPTVVVGGLIAGTVAAVGVGTYFYDQRNNNATANNLDKYFGICS